MKSIQGARVNSQTQDVGGPEHSSVLAKGFPSEREICRNLRHNNGYNPRILYTVSELFIHALTRFPTLPPSAGDVSRGFTRGPIRVPEGAFCVKLWRSVPLVSTTCDSVLPFPAQTRVQIPPGTPNQYITGGISTLCLTRDWKSPCSLTFLETADYEFSPKPPCCLGRVDVCRLWEIHINRLGWGIMRPIYEPIWISARRRLSRCPFIEKASSLRPLIKVRKQRASTE